MIFPAKVAAQEINSASGGPVIKVVGVGGCGGNVIGHMASSGLRGVTFIAANTDAQALVMARVDHTVKLGPEGFFESSGPEVGRRAAEESFAAIKDAIGEVHLAFIVAGMGGRTGSGAAPVVARAAKENGAGLTVGVVAKPWSFEGKKRINTAEAGIAELRRHVDCLIALPIERLQQAAAKQVTLNDVFKQADEVISIPVRCISNMLTRPGPVNLDFADVASVLRGAGKAVMGVGAASGENRARDAAAQALAGPLLKDVSLGNARGVLLNITARPDLAMTEVHDAHAAILNETHKDAAILLSVALDESMDDEMRITFIASIS